MRTVGIDLGTTHVVVAYEDGDAVREFAVPQLVSSHEEDALPLLASILYAPEPEECAATAVHEGWVAGAFARRRAGDTDGRAIVSSKSWLSYAGVDRSARILPWRLDDGEPGPARISPVDAARLLLAHVRRAWDARFPREPLAGERVVLTVPASFDAVARELTVEAARRAGLSPVLLEEPQAAFLDWAVDDAALASALPEGADAGTVLVIDVGGGTTDLSLIEINRSAGGFSLRRRAIGRHLLVGGDNMDLALAHHVAPRLSADALSPRRFAELVQACRRAKERLLAADAPEAVTVTLHGSGSRLLAGARSAELTRAEVETLLVDGFFPFVTADAAPSRARTAVVAFGLPYERDVAITRHVAAFVAKHGEPTAVLLNGGVFHASVLAERLFAVLDSWRSRPLTRLPARRVDTAVARGAVRYGCSLAGRGRRIRAGAPQSYLVGVATSDGRTDAVCVLPQGSEDGVVHRLSRPLALTLGRTVRFPLWSADAALPVGSIAASLEELDPLPALVLALDGEGDVAVELEASLSAVGTLDLACLASDTRRFRLSFDLASEAMSHDSPPPKALDRRRIDEAGQLLEAVFGKGTTGDERDAKQLLRELERVLGRREGWDGATCRAIFDRLSPLHRGRRRTAEHERAFWMLAGYTLRPGFGAPRDGERASSLAALFDARLAHSEPRLWQQFWIAWRRIAGGLDEAAQTRVRDVLDPELAPKELRLKRDKGFRNDAAWEMLELAAGLERVAPERRAELGGWIVERTWTERDARLWSALGRIGGRVPVYASAHHAVRAGTVERWMDHLVRERWESLPTAPAAALAMCRLTGDAERDVSARTRQLVDRKLAALGLDDAARAPLHDVVALDASDRSAFFGEALPDGLRVLDGDDRASSGRGPAR